MGTAGIFSSTCFASSLIVVLTLPHSRFQASGQLFTISARGDQTWVVHEAILSESPVLAKICQTPMAEAKSKLIKIPEDDPGIFGRLLEYLYCGDYSPWLTTSPITDGTSVN